MKLNGAANGYVHFIGSDNNFGWVSIEISDLPPPLITSDLDGERILMFTQARQCFASADARYDEHENNEYRDSYGRQNKPVCAMLCVRRALVFGFNLFDVRGRAPAS